MDTDIKKLIEKYYQGKTSLEEEKQLRNSLFSKDIKDADLYSHLIFNAFGEEKEEKAPFSTKTLLPTANKPKKFTFYRKKWLYGTSGIAACFVFVVGMYFYKYQQENTAYVIINGVRINDEKLAMQYLNESYMEEKRIMEKCLAPVYEMEKIEKKLDKIAENSINF
jgi:hypothetical protein